MYIEVTGGHMFESVELGHKISKERLAEEFQLCA